MRIRPERKLTDAERKALWKKRNEQLRRFVVELEEASKATKGSKLRFAC